MARRSVEKITKQHAILILPVIYVSPRWRGSVTRANISIHIANNKVTYE